MTGAEAAAVFKGLMFIAQTKAELSEKDMHAMLRSAMNPGSAGRRIGGLARSATSNRSSNGRFAGPANDQQRSSKTPDAGDAGGNAPSLSDLSSSPDQENSSSLSASSGSDSKRARRTKRARRCPEDWQLSGELRELAAKLGIRAVGLEAQKFRDHEFAAPRSDWDAAFRNWLRRAAEHASTQPAASSRDGVPIVKHPVFRPEPPIPASERPSQSEITQMLSKVGRVAT